VTVQGDSLQVLRTIEEGY